MDALGGADIFSRAHHVSLGGFDTFWPAEAVDADSLRVEREQHRPEVLHLIAQDPEFLPLG
jgi:hypothetical protein